MRKLKQHPQTKKSKEGVSGKSKLEIFVFVKLSHSKSAKKLNLPNKKSQITNWWNKLWLVKKESRIGGINCGW